MFTKEELRQIIREELNECVKEIVQAILLVVKEQKEKSLIP